MSWETVLKIILASVASAGGIGGILLLAAKFGSGILADRISQRYGADLKIELDEFRTLLSKREYVSKVRFDTEFNIYRDLSKVFFDLQKATSSLVDEYMWKISDVQIQEQQEEMYYKNTNAAYVIAQDTLHQNEPFIQKQFYCSYQDYLKLGAMQLDAYQKRFDDGYFAPPDVKSSFTIDDRKRTKEMDSMLHSLNDSIRDYLSRLYVAE